MTFRKSHKYESRLDSDDEDGDAIAMFPMRRNFSIYMYMRIEMEGRDGVRGGFEKLLPIILIEFRKRAFLFFFSLFHSTLSYSIHDNTFLYHAVEFPFLFASY